MRAQVLLNIFSWSPDVRRGVNQPGFQQAAQRCQAIIDCSQGDAGGRGMRAMRQRAMLPAVPAALVDARTSYWITKEIAMYGQIPRLRMIKCFAQEKLETK